MRFRTAGFLQVLLCPIVSFLLILLIRTFWIVERNYSTPTLDHIIYNFLVMGTQVSGLIFYHVGRQRGEAKSKLFPFFNGFSRAFIVLGIITILGALAFYNIALQSWRLRGGEFTLLDHTRYRTWAIQGALWITSGAIFLTF